MNKYLELLQAIEEVITLPECGIYPDECYPDDGSVDMEVIVNCEAWRTLSELWDRRTREMLAPCTCTVVPDFIGEDHMSMCAGTRSVNPNCPLHGRNEVPDET